jgi:hypothetical protein
MKKLVIALVAMVVTSVQAFAVGITIQCKAHYSSDTRNCEDATKGVCMIIRAISIEPSSKTFNGNIVFDRSQGFVLTFSKSKDMTQTTYSAYFGGGSFLVDGDSPISTEVLKSISCPYSSFTIKQGKYLYSVDGDIITVIIPATDSSISK